MDILESLLEPDTDRERAVLERILTLKQLIKDGMGGPLELHELGICYFNIENYHQAADYLQRLGHEYPDYLEIGSAQSLRVLALIRMGEYTDAEKILQSRLKVDAQDTRLLGMLAHIQERSGKVFDAIATHRRILELDPQNLNSMNNLGYLLTLHGGQNNQSEALSFLKRVLSAKPGYPAYLDSLGVHLTRLGDRERARKAFMKALSKMPESSEILGHLKEVMSE